MFRYVILFFLLAQLACGGINPVEIKEYRRKLLVEGKPFLMLGAQLRTDFFLQLDKRTPDQLDDYFQLAAGMNITVIQVPISWRDVEPDKDIYSDKLIDQYIRYCEKYDLKLEILWFGSYMCGYSVEGYIPPYVLNDTQNYPELNASADFEGWLGKHYFLTPNTDLLVEREQKAIAFMMEAIEEYDRRNGRKHTVIGIQIENEPDMLTAPHDKTHGFSPEALWGDLIQMLDRLGQVVKKAEYDCYTRVNLTTAFSDYSECLIHSKEIVATEGIDYVGIDPYQNEICQISNKLEALHAIEDNFGHVAENGGEFANNDILALKALTMGCGYEVFEVITTPHPWLSEWTLRGVYHPDFTPKPHTRQIIDAFKIMKDCQLPFASAEIDDMYGFNLQNDKGLDITSEGGTTTNYRIEWATKERGIAYAIEYGNYLFVASTKQDHFHFPNHRIMEAEEGYYNSDGQWHTTTTVLADRGELIVEPCKVYRLKLNPLKPIIVVTDLYHPPQDPGDNFDLIMGFALPEVDLKAIILDITDEFRKDTANIFNLSKDTEGPREPGVIPVMQLNYIYDRTVPFGLGPMNPMRSEKDEMTDISLFQQGGVNLLINTLKESELPIDILSFGSLRPIAVAYNREPQLFKEKVRMIHISAGNSGFTGVKIKSSDIWGNISGGEWNVALDIFAFTRLLRSELPISVYPCAGKNGVFGLDPHNTYWRLNHIEDFIRKMNPRLQQYLEYAFSRKATIDFLKAMDKRDLFSYKKQNHHVWETAIWINVADMLLVQTKEHDYRIIPENSRQPSDRIIEYQMLPCKFNVYDDGNFTFETTTEGSNSFLYYRSDPAENERALQQALPSLYLSF